MNQPTRPPASVEDADVASLDSDLAATQFEAIIRAWKGEAVGQTVPASPVGEVDWDGSLALGQLDTAVIRLCESYSYFSTKDCGIGSSYDCIPYTWAQGCSLGCSWIESTCDANNCQYG